MPTRKYLPSAANRSRKPRGNVISSDVLAFTFPGQIGHNLFTREDAAFSFSRPDRHYNVLAIALANKLARIAWAVLAKGRAFELTRTDDAGVRPA